MDFNFLHCNGLGTASRRRPGHPRQPRRRDPGAAFRRKEGLAIGSGGQFGAGLAVCCRDPARTTLADATLIMAPKAPLGSIFSHSTPEIVAANFVKLGESHY
jgi:hypothetical protein